MMQACGFEISGKRYDDIKRKTKSWSYLDIYNDNSNLFEDEETSDEDIFAMTIDTKL